MNDRIVDLQSPLVMDGILENEWRSFVGKESNYYIEKWESVDNPGKSSGWNWSAFLGSMFWMGYRKMYREAVLTLLMLFVIYTFELLFKVDEVIVGLISWVFLIGCGSYGNAIYYNFARRKIIKANSQDPSDDVTRVLNKSGGISRIGVWIMIILTFAFSYLCYQLLPYLGIDKKLF